MNNKCLKICLINPINKKGIYDAKNAKVIDYILVDFYEFNFFLFCKTLVIHIETLLQRNGILPED